MDGNRRYAEARALRKVEGHAYGYARLLDALEWCLQVGCGLGVGGTWVQPAGGTSAWQGPAPRAEKAWCGHGCPYIGQPAHWCAALPVQLGVACVSVYAFSIDNYRRSGEEVATLMALAEDKLAHLLEVN